MAQSPGFIPMGKAIEMTKRFRQNKKGIIHPSHEGKDLLANSDKFDRTVFETLLAKPGCKGIRIYYGMKDDLKICPIVVAVDDKDRDILPAGDMLESAAVEGDNVGDDTIRCPPICPPPSPLNEP